MVRPSGCLKNIWRSGRAVRQRRAYGRAKPKRQVGHELPRALLAHKGVTTDVAAARLFRCKAERSDTMTASSIRAAAVSLAAITIAGCTTTGFGTGQSANGRLSATFNWTE